MKAFFLFVSYTTLASGHSTIVHIRIFLGGYWHLSAAHRGTPWFWSELFTLHYVGIMISAIAALIVSLLLGTLTSEMAIAIGDNYMEVEDIIADAAAKSRGRRGMECLAFPYDLGYYENLLQVFGQRRCLWPLPTIQRGDGIWIPMAADCGQFDVPAEQLAMQAQDLLPRRIVTVKPPILPKGFSDGC
jgi:hypothetical protein